MKQSVIDQMKEYKHRNNIKAIKYEEGMEDAWLCRAISDNECETDKIFESKESAYKFQQSSVHPVEIIPVMLNEIDGESYVDEYDFQIYHNGKYYEFEEVRDGNWIYIENGHVFVEEDSEYFLENYEPCINTEMASIKYDKIINQVFVRKDNKGIAIDRTEIATVEKILEALKIPYTERIGEMFRYDNEGKA